MIDLENLRAALQQRTQAPFALWGWQQTPEADAWGIVTMDGQAGAVWSDDEVEMQGIRGHVQLFCRRPGSLPSLVQSALRGLRVHWNFETSDYEPDTRLLHYTWAWRDWGDLNGEA